jgi:hypothetical protein
LQRFGTKPRSWEAYLAGLGASGALMASASVMFVILVGVVTFKTWPHAADLLGDGGGEVALESTAKPARGQGTAESTPNVVRLPGGSAPASARQSGTRGGGSIGIRNGQIPGGNGLAPGGSTGQPGGSTGEQPQGAQQPPSEPTQPTNVVSKAVSDVGNTVQQSTDGLGDALGGSSSPGLGGVLGGAGRTLNDNLQSLAGKQ